MDLHTAPLCQLLSIFKNITKISIKYIYVAIQYLCVFYAYRYMYLYIVQCSYVYIRTFSTGRMYHRTEAKILDVIRAKVFRVFLLAIYSHLYLWILSPPLLSKSGLKWLVM
jgi:hypothetical protein